MKINIPDNCVIIAGVCYELVEGGDGDCEGCAFKNGRVRGCDYYAPCVNIFCEYNTIFKKVEIVTND